MSEVLDAIARHAQTRPDALAIDAAPLTLSYLQLSTAIDALAAQLREQRCQRVALLSDNSAAWAVAELAISAAGLVSVPLPPFFSQQQIAHALRSAGIDALLLDPALVLPPPLASLPSLTLSAADAGTLRLLRLPFATTLLHERTRKITYTSGTTGEPKGVCLGTAEQERVAAVLIEASAAAADSRHLCVLPLSTLLENIGGLYAPLLAGATACIRPLADVGLGGASQLDVSKLIAAINASAATSVILVPQMLLALVAAIEAGAPRPSTLRFIAVGGASVSPRLLERAHRLGLPVFEGYGLSECSSVVALNRPGAERADTVGKPLPHVQILIAADGEICVTGNLFRGYVGEPAPDRTVALRTGDIGRLDADGFLQITGRKKNIFVTSFGRNVSPDWVERELCLQAPIAQAALFGEAAPFNVAVIVARGDASDAAIDGAIAAVNAELPDYARVRRWLRASAPFATTNDQGTANGRLRRAVIRAAYGDAIDACYGNAAVPA